MCVKNINSYGCGHNYREISSCGQNCTPEAGYKFIREYDCGACKAAGDQLSRGRDGLGRHGQARMAAAAATARRENKEEIQSVTGPVVDCSGEVSPWAQSPIERRGEKPVLSGRRRRDADEAWEHEHRSRLNDLCSRAESMSIRSDATPRPIPASPVSPATPASPYHYDHHQRRPRDHHYDHDNHRRRHRSPSPVDFYSSTDDDRPPASVSLRFGQVMSVADLASMRPRRRQQQQHQQQREDHHYRSHHDSQDSLDSIPKVTSTGTSARRRAQKPDSYFLIDPPDSGYGSRGGSRSHRSHGSRAGSYAYSASPQSPPIYQHKHQPPTANAYPTGYYEYSRDHHHQQHHQAPPPISLPRYSTY